MLVIFCEFFQYVFRLNGYWKGLNVWRWGTACVNTSLCILVIHLDTIAWHGLMDHVSCLVKFYRRYGWNMKAINKYIVLNYRRICFLFGLSIATNSALHPDASEPVSVIPDRRCNLWFSQDRIPRFITPICGTIAYISYRSISPGNWNLSKIAIAASHHP